MSISMIAAVGKNNELGKNNDLIWHYKQDMLFFKEKTQAKTVIMGKKTFLSLPKALPGRRNIVLTHQSDFHAQDAQIVHSVQEALQCTAQEDVFIIGGAGVYEQFLPYADFIYLTHIDAGCTDADTFFPDFDTTRYQQTVLNRIEIDGVTLTFKLYEKKNSVELKS